MYKSQFSLVSPININLIRCGLYIQNLCAYSYLNVFLSFRLWILTEMNRYEWSSQFKYLSNRTVCINRNRIYGSKCWFIDYKCCTSVKRDSLKWKRIKIKLIFCLCVHWDTNSIFLIEKTKKKKWELIINANTTIHNVMCDTFFFAFFFSLSIQRQIEWDAYWI